ncbi:asparagine synthase (glutamine-hydrolyzing) [Dactylosporangium sp. CA-139114]|uniref:asparagine synthase (glutamine-hydrolyzing) n=1 Tax=Dactylosporangium sp. CA-139114 TaxID=3239931 RepID=UPI003D993EC7
MLRECGIVGWVAFDHDVRAHRPTLRAMTATMALRGPDGEGVWLGRHAGLGHRRLSVLDPGTGAQPMLAVRDGRVLAAVTYSGFVHSLAGPRTDTEEVLRAYLRWGEDFAGHLEGMFALAVWDERRECLLLVRDRLGVKPLYYQPVPGGVLFASEPKGIAAHPLGRLRVGLDGLRELLAGVRTPGHAVYADLREVRPGELVRVDRDGVCARRYWRLGAAGHTDGPESTVDTVRGLVEQAVHANLHTAVPLCALLSGGLDSTVVAGLAARELQRAGADPLRTVAVEVPGSADGPPARAAAAALGTRHETVLLDAAAIADPLPRAEALAALEFPTGLGDFHTSLYLMFRDIAEHSTVALSGEGADELFGGYPWCHDERARDAGTFPWLVPPYLVRADPDGPPTDVLDPGLSAGLDLVEYRDAAYRDALSEVDHLDDEPAQDRRMREVRHLQLTRLLPILLDRTDRMSAACGVEVRVPFCDHRLVDYVHNVPWSLHTADGREKSLLRAALPRFAPRRRKSPYPTVSDPAYELALRAQLMHVLEDSAGPVLPLLDRARAWHLVVAPIAPPGHDAGRRALELVLGLDLWLRRLPVTLAL